jgi:hypothetical protein
MEFGCNKARTMRLAWEVCHCEHNWTYVGFDSFEGLPEIQAVDEMPIWKKGDCAYGEQAFIDTLVLHGMPREKLITVRGFYDESLTPELKHQFLPAKAVVIYIDCDFYASALLVLRFVKDLLQRGTILVFDDWFCFFGDPDHGERRAFREFCEQNPDLVFQDFILTSEIKAFIYLGTRESKDK